MPYKSAKQAAKFAICRENPEKAKGKCPPMKVLREFQREQRRTDKQPRRFY